jgi:hypothetical protein
MPQVFNCCTPQGFLTLRRSRIAYVHKSDVISISISVAHPHNFILLYFLNVLRFCPPIASLLFVIGIMQSKRLLSITCLNVNFLQLKFEGLY